MSIKQIEIRDDEGNVVAAIGPDGTIAGDVTAADQALEILLKLPNCAAINAAKSAVSHIVRRLIEDKELRYRIGVGTETYEKVTHAASLLFGQPVDEVREKIIPGSAAIHRS